MLIVTLLLAATLQVEEPWDVAERADSAVMAAAEEEVAARWTRRLQASPDDWAAYLGLGTLGLLTYDSLRADRHFQPLADRAPGVWRIFGLYGLARRYVAGARFAAADSLLSLAVTESGDVRDPRLSDELWLALAQVRMRTRGASVAGALLDSLEATSSIRTPIGRARHQCVLAEIAAVRGGSGTAAAQVGMRAATIAADFRMRAYCGMTLGGILAADGRADTARVVFTGVIEDGRRVRDPGWEAIGLQWRGYLDRINGRLGRAAEDLGRAVSRATEAGAGGVRSWALLNLALVYLELDDAPAGLRYARAALEAFGDEGDLFQVGSLRQVEALLLLRSGEHALALRRFEELARDAEAIGFRDLAVGARTGAAHAAILGDRPDIARDQARRVLDTAAEIGGGGHAATAHYLALAVARATDDRPEVLEHLAWATDGLAPQEHYWRYHFAMRRAEDAADRGDLATARRAAAESLDAMERMREELGPRQMRLRAFERTADLSDPDLGFATVVSALAEGGSTESAFRLSERFRTGEMLRRLLQAEAISDVVGEDIRRSTPPVPELDAVKAALPAGTAMVSFMTGRGDEPTTAILVGPEATAVRTLPPVDSLRSAVVRLHQLWSASAPADQVVGELSRALVEPLAGDPVIDGASHLVIVPHQELYDLPWSALTLPDGRYVAERWSVTVVPSASVAMRLWARPRRSGPAHALVIADAAAPGDLPPLPGARTEARRVASFVDEAVIRLGEDATEAWLKQTELEPFRIIHAATHAMVDDAGLTAGLALAAGDGEDGLLRPGEVGRLALDADLVVLSACHSASGGVLRGEGLRGLVGPLIEAGGRSVVATRWRVADDATSRFVERVYEALAEGHDVAEALRLSRARAIADDEPAAHWAAFALLGDGTVRLPLNRRRTPLAVSGILALAALLFAWRITQREGVGA